jgi:aflatoxin B1 aldehyde reductase
MAPAAPRTNLPIVLGAMTIGGEGQQQSRIHSIPEASTFIDTFTSHGHRELDTSRFYGLGTSEQMLGQLEPSWQTRGIRMQTKFYPSAVVPGNFPVERFSLTPEDMEKNLKLSLAALKAEDSGLDMWYLHAPDRKTPIEVTLKGANELYKQGHFKRFAISNYQAWEVAQICELCDRNGWVKPSVYQGLYNGIHRAVEPELLACLRKYGIGFYAYNPVAGGFLTDKFRRDTAQVETGSRFDSETWQGKGYRARSVLLLPTEIVQTF